MIPKDMVLLGMLRLETSRAPGQRAFVEGAAPGMRPLPKELPDAIDQSTNSASTCVDLCFLSARVRGKPKRLVR